MAPRPVSNKILRAKKRERKLLLESFFLISSMLHLRNSHFDPYGLYDVQYPDSHSAEKKYVSAGPGGHKNTHLVGRISIFFHLKPLSMVNISHVIMTYEFHH